MCSCMYTYMGVTGKIYSCAHLSGAQGQNLAEPGAHRFGITSQPTTSMDPPVPSSPLAGRQTKMLLSFASYVGFGSPSSGPHAFICL